LPTQHAQPIVNVLGSEIRHIVHAAAEGGVMRLLRSKIWSPVDIACLKWCCLLLGMIAGAHLPEYTKEHVGQFFIGAALLAVKPTISYFSNDE
jgi:hypothetical protein